MPREWAEPQLKRMVDRLQHESFYVTGTWIDETSGTYVGWVARRNAFAEVGAMRGERPEHTLIFSGEDFSGLGAGQRQSDGMPVYISELAETDPGFPAKLNGRFHGLVADRTSGTATLFNDRYGLHRIYHYQAPEAFYFAAEAKAILAVRPELRRIEPVALGEYITCGCVLENKTLFDGLSVLPGGSKWILRNGSVEHKGHYFESKEWEEQDILCPEAYYQRLREVFTEKIGRYFQAKGGVGLSLTGGLDTRMIMAWHRPLPGSLPCYTFGGAYRDSQDVIVARQVAFACEQPHQVLEVGKAFLSQFQHYAERTVYLTDGCADVRRASDLYLNQYVRQIAPVRITGNYGSEVLRGVRAFKPNNPVPGLFAPEMSDYFRQANETYSTLLVGHPVSFAVFKQAPWHHYGLLALEETQVSLRSPYLDNDLVRIVFQAPRSVFEGHDVCLRLVSDGSPALRRIPTDRNVGQAGLIGSVLRKQEDFLAKAEYAYDYGMPQWLAKIDHAFAPLHLERLFLGRQKFNHYRVWYRDVLTDYIAGVLLDQQSLSRAYIERRKVENLILGHLKGKNSNYTNEIHTLLTLELLHRVFVDTN